MGLAEYFLNDFETSNNPSDRRLCSRYYNNDYYMVQNTISSVFNSAGYKLMHVDNNYHEMLFQSKKAQLIVTLSEMSMYEIKVDIKINTTFFIPLKRGVKIIDELYNLLDRRLTLKFKGYKDEK